MTGGGRYARVEDANQTPGTSVNCFHENRTYCGILVPKRQQNRFRRTDKDQDNAILLQIDQSGECMCHMSGKNVFNTYRREGLRVVLLTQTVYRQDRERKETWRR